MTVTGTGPEPAAGTPQGAENSADERGKVADRLRKFVAAHGGSGSAVLSPLGRPGVRIVVVAADGRYADAVVSSAELASSVCESAGLQVTDWDRDLTSRVVVTAGDRQRMAGTGR